MATTNSKPPTGEVEGCFESVYCLDEKHDNNSAEETQPTTHRPSPFVRNQVASWQKQFAHRTPTKQQKKLLAYFTKVLGRQDLPHGKKKPAICHVINRKGVL